VIDNIVLNKAAIIRRRLDRIRDVYGGDPGRLEEWDVQDILVLNLQRACEAAIDLGMHVVARDRLGTPQRSRDAFALLEGAGRIDAALSRNLQAMVGFRNIAIHDYQQIQREVLEAILEGRLEDFERFIGAVGAAPPGA